MPGLSQRLALPDCLCFLRSQVASASGLFAADVRYWHLADIRVRLRMPAYRKFNWPCGVEPLASSLACLVCGGNCARVSPLRLARPWRSGAMHP